MHRVTIDTPGETQVRGHLCRSKRRKLRDQISNILTLAQRATDPATSNIDAQQTYRTSSSSVLALSDDSILS